jgi:3-keto-disaccharide hydrolase
MAIRCQCVVSACVLGILLSDMVANVTAAENEQGFVLLTGDDARTRWQSYGPNDAKERWPSNWEFFDGVLHSRGGGSDLRSRQEYGDFDLRFDWKISPKGNSGVLYRVSLESDPAYYTGPEYQLIDDVGNRDMTSPLTSTASVYALYAPNKQLAKSAGEWNEGRIVVQNNHVEHFLNGEKVVDCELGSDDWNRRVAGSKFADWKKFGRNARGYIDLQDHGDEVWFRNVRIRSFDGARDRH